MQKKLWIVIIVSLGCFLFYPAVQAESPKQIQYIAIGDSLTAGYGSSEQNYLRINGFVPQFVQYLKNDYSVTVENHGIPGLSSIGLFTYLQTDVGLQNRLREADIITLSIGGNDFLQTIRSFQNSADETALRQRAFILEQTYKAIHNKIRELNPDAKLFLIGIYNPYPINHPLREAGLTYAQQFNDQLTNYSKEEITSIINPLDAFVDNETTYTHILKDDIHPTDTGYDVIVQQLIIAFEQMK